MYLLRQRLLLSAFIGLIITGVAMRYIANAKADIENSVVRLHVVANSNSIQDQQLKLKVRDSVLQYLHDSMEAASSAEQTKEEIKNQLQAIADAACMRAQSEGCLYTVEAQLGNFRFPTKQYDNARLPCGNYDALRIIIGGGGGENWWCVLYPQLCLASSKNGTLPEDSCQRLKNVLTEDEYNIVANSTDGSCPVKIKFKLLELFRL